MPAIPDLDTLTDWDKMGICWATPGWYAQSYFRAPYSVPKLEQMGLVETRVEPGRMGDITVETKMIRLTDAGLRAKVEIENSGFDIFGKITGEA